MCVCTVCPKGDRFNNVDAGQADRQTDSQTAAAAAAGRQQEINNRLLSNVTSCSSMDRYVTRQALRR
jgi:hypothetical protein